MAVKQESPYAQRTKPSRKAIQRAVASSTALETGQSVEAVELKLRSKKLERFRHLTLAD
jgi:hypothetical protein